MVKGSRFEEIKKIQHDIITNVINLFRVRKETESIKDRII